MKLQNIDIEKLDGTIEECEKCGYKTLEQIIGDIEFNVRRKDNSYRKVKILKDENSGKYRFVNLTEGHYHICPCSFDTIELALFDLRTDPNVDYFEPRTPDLLF